VAAPSFVLRNAKSAILRRAYSAFFGWVSLAGLYALALGGLAYRTIVGSAIQGSLPGTITLVALVSFLLALVFRIRGGNLCDVVVDADGVKLERGPFARHIARSKIAGGLVVSKAGKPAVELQLESGNAVRIACESPAEAERILEVLALDPGKRRVAVGPGRDAPLPLWMSLFAWVTALVTVLPMRKLSSELGLGGMGFAVWLVGSTVAAWALARALTPREVVVGTDGLLVHQLFRKRFIPYAEITQCAHVRNEGLVISLTGGERLRIGSRHAGGEYIDALVDRIAAARASVGGTSPAATVARLERDGRPLAGWRQALHAIVTGEGYRSGPLERADLLSALDDVAAPTDRRIGAALALRELGDDEARARIRVAAAAAANDRLRIALDGIGGDELDEAAIEEALAADQAAARQAIE
jgi:Lon protease-like protein